MQLFYDLHIHTALSPCAENEMRPRAIARTARRNGLDIVCVLDHVCGKNIRAAKSAAEEEGLLFLPGVEATSSQGTHLLCYFADADAAVEFSELIYNTLPSSVAVPFLYGEQLILDAQDNEVGRAEKHLSSCSKLSTWEIIGLCAEYGGVVVPAHINRIYNGLLNTEGNKLAEYGFAAVEVKKTYPMDYGIIKHTKVIYNSDAHSLFSIADRINMMEVGEKSVEAVLDYLTR